MGKLKHIFDLGTEAVLATVLLSILGFSFFSAYNIKPQVTYDSVLGLSTQTQKSVIILAQEYSGKGLNVSNQLQQDKLHTQIITVNRIAEPVSYNAFSITNNTDRQVAYNLHLSMGKEYYAGMAYYVYVNKQQHLLANGDWQQVKDLLLKVDPAQTAQVVLQIVPKAPLNYSFGFKLSLEKV